MRASDRKWRCRCYRATLPITNCITGSREPCNPLGDLAEPNFRPPQQNRNAIGTERPEAAELQLRCGGTERTSERGTVSEIPPWKFFADVPPTRATLAITRVAARSFSTSAGCERHCRVLYQARSKDDCFSLFQRVGHGAERGGGAAGGEALGAPTGKGECSSRKLHASLSGRIASMTRETPGAGRR